MLSMGASTDVSVSRPAGSNELPGLLSVFNTVVLLFSASAATRSEYIGLAILVIDPLTALTTERVILHWFPPASPVELAEETSVGDLHRAFVDFDVHASADAGVLYIGVFCRVRMSPNRATPLFALTASMSPLRAIVMRVYSSNLENSA